MTRRGVAGYWMFPVIGLAFVTSIAAAGEPQVRAGLSASASVGLGLGENVLVGGSNRAFMLQPTSHEGQVGFNIATVVTRVTLDWAP